MKTIFALALTSLCLWSVATAQTPPHFRRMETKVSLDEEAPTPKAHSELSTSRSRIRNAWFPNFKQYVSEHIQYPSAARETGLEGVVGAEAVVQTDGKLTDIRIVEPLSYSCDKAVKKMLSNMPPWNAARRDGVPIEQKVFVRVHFKLELF